MRPAASRRAMKQPSHLISCSQPGPAGGRWASAGWQGRMNQTGLERVRIGREETRQSIRRREEKGGAASLTGGGSDCESGWTYLTPNNMARSCTKFSHSLDRNPLTDLSVVGLKMGSIVQFEKAFASVGWFIPAYVQMGGLKRLPKPLRNQRPAMLNQNWSARYLLSTAQRRLPPSLCTATRLCPSLSNLSRLSLSRSKHTS
jgi:hypothetical protein